MSLELRTLQLGAPGREPWQTTVLDLPRSITEAMVLSGCRQIERWQSLFDQEFTWARAQHGVPSLHVRLDCVPNFENETLECCEIEERPQGAGLGKLVNSQFAQRFDKVRPHWPDRIVSVSSPDRRGGDDHLWAEEMSIEQALSELGSEQSRSLSSPNWDTTVITRCEPHQEQFWPLAPRAIAPIQTEGSKRYGEHLGWWQLVTADMAPQLPGPGRGYCLKPLQGSKCRDVLVVHPNCALGGSGNKRLVDGRKVGGWSRNQAANHLCEQGEMYCQPFIPPLEAEIGTLGPYNHLYRIHYAYWPGHGWYCLGGTWWARPCPQLLIHGACDTIVGPVVIE